MSRSWLAASFLCSLGCGSPNPITPDCILPDGTELVGGQTIAGDDCRACDARTGEIRVVWGPSCGGYESREAPVGGSISLGPDADGDGFGDIALGGESSRGGARGAVRVYNSITGVLIFEADGEREQLLMTRAVLGPDISGDGLADLLVSSANSFDDALYDSDGVHYGEAPNPGLVIAYEPITGRELARWEGERPCESLGYAIDLAADADGDGLGEILILDGGCQRAEEPEGEASYFVLSGIAGPPLAERTSRGTMAEPAFDNRVRLTVREGRTELDYKRFIDHETHIIHEDLSTGEVVLDVLLSSDVRALAWDFGYDLTGDGAPDGIGSVTPSRLVPPFEGDQPNILLPDMQLPVGEYLVIASGVSTYYEIVSDADGDGRDDVLVFEVPPSLDPVLYLRAPSGETIYTHRGPTPGRPESLRTLGAISRPYDFDGDGCMDFASTAEIRDTAPDHTTRITSNLEIHRCAGW